MAAHLTAL